MNSNKNLIREVNLEDSPYKVFEHFHPKNPIGQKRVYFAYDKSDKFIGTDIGKLTKYMQITIDLVPYLINGFSQWIENKNKFLS